MPKEKQIDYQGQKTNYSGFQSMIMVLAVLP